MKKLAIEGPHCYMSPEEIDRLYEELFDFHHKYLKKFDVKMPKEHTIKALQLIFLYKHRNKLVHKDSISIFIRSMIDEAGKDQQARHLATQNGWYILNKNENIPGYDDFKVPSGYHLFFDYKTPKPSYYGTILKRKGRMAASTFEDLVSIYDHKCATCGAEEGKPHPRFLDKKVELQQGHMNPNFSLNLENTIPQCQICNQIYQDFFVFDENGFIKSIHNAYFILRSDDRVKESMFEVLKTVLKK